MKWDEERDGYQDNVSLGPIFVGAISLVLLIALVVVLSNQRIGKTKAKPQDNQARIEETTQTEAEEKTPERLVVGESTRRADDLNFWDMYPEEEQKEDNASSGEQVVKPSTNEEEKVTDPAKDGKHVEVTLEDGTKKWLAINNSLPKNNYDLTGFQKEDELMKYYQNGQLKSYAGVTVDKYAGVVDFEALKKQGITFVMLRVGQRGYETGEVTLDEHFKENLVKAKEAGLAIGVYFVSHAVSAQEAAEELNFMIAQCADEHITYPMAVKLELIANDTARTKNLSKNDRTTILRCFLEGIATANYKPALLAEKNDLLTKVDLAALSGFGIWLNQPGNQPDYPYQYQMWQYGDGAKLKGGSEHLKLNLSLIDYAAR